MKNYSLRTGRIIGGLMTAALAISFFWSAATDADAASLSAKEKEYYKNVITSKQYLEDSGIYDGGSFTMSDLNGDGKKELLIEGALGLRTMTFTIIYSYDGSNFNHYEVNGSVTKASKKGFFADCEDYENAGEIRYSSNSLYKFDKSGEASEIAGYDTTLKYNKSDDSYSVTSKKIYKIKGKKQVTISKSKYNKLIKNYKLKKLKYHEINDENLDKYIK